MALVMLSFMISMMYMNPTLNAIVIVSAMLLSGTAYYASRSQLFVDDERYMKGMIPHHSIAVLTSERADLDDLRVSDAPHRAVATRWPLTAGSRFDRLPGAYKTVIATHAEADTGSRAPEVARVQLVSNDTSRN